jgi:hypothetical protein
MDGSNREPRAVRPDPATIAATASAAAPAPGSLIGRSLLGIRLSAILETAVFLGVAAAIDHLYFGGNRFWEVSPHPFWILVLLVSVQYGTNEGAFAAVACSAVLLTGPLPAQSIDTSTHAHLLHLGARPLMWLCSAIVLGEIRNRQFRRATELQQQLAESRAREERIAEAYQDLAAAHERLEIGVASELRTVVNVHRAARALQNLALDDIVEGAAGLIAAVLGPERFSLYLVEDGALRLRLKRGWPADDAYDTTVPPEHPLFQAVAVARRYLVAVDSADEHVLAQQGVLAGPLLYGEGGDLAGMVKIESLRFADLTLTAIENFKVVCELLSIALGNARRYDAAAAQSILSTDQMLLSDAFYARQAAFLAALGRRIGFPVSLMRVSVENPDALTAEQSKAVPKIIRDSAFEALRSTDLAFEYKAGRWQYVVVLPNTSMDDMPAVIEKFRTAALAKLGSDRARLAITGEALVGEATRRKGRIAAASADYARQSQFLAALARIAHFPLSAVRLSVSAKISIPSDLRARLAAILLSVVRESLGETELAYSLEDSGLLVILLLPGRDITLARIRAETLRHAVTRKLGANAGPFTIRVEVEDLAGAAPFKTLVVQPEPAEVALTNGVRAAQP